MARSTIERLTVTKMYGTYMRATSHTTSPHLFPYSELGIAISMFRKTEKNPGKTASFRRSPQRNIPLVCTESTREIRKVMSGTHYMRLLRASDVCTYKIQPRATSTPFQRQDGSIYDGRARPYSCFHVMNIFNNLCIPHR